MQDILDKLKENPRIVVAVLIVAGLLALIIGGGGNNTDNAKTDVTQQDQSSEQTTVTATDNAENNEATKNDKQVIGNEPAAGPVEIKKEATVYSATVRKGDNQTVVARQMVNDYLGDQSKSLSAEQRLYAETVVVDSLPRNDLIYANDVIKVEETTIANAVAASGELTEAQIALWSAYL